MLEKRACVYLREKKGASSVAVNRSRMTLIGTTHPPLLKANGIEFMRGRGGKKEKYIN